MPRIPYFIFTMSNKKAQIEMKEMILTLVVVGILFSIGVLIFAKVESASNNLLDPDKSTARNESVTLVWQASSNDNSTLLAKSRVIENSETVANATGVTKILTRDVDYSITLTGGSGSVGTRANLTFIDPSAYNDTALKVTYQFNSESAAQASQTLISTTVLDSFELGVIALIVLAAVVILGILFKLGSQ